MPNALLSLAVNLKYKVIREDLLQVLNKKFYFLLFFL